MLTKKRNEISIDKKKMTAEEGLRTEYGTREREKKGRKRRKKKKKAKRRRTEEEGEANTLQWNK